MILFSDGGCVGPNPSPIGGMWAFCHVSYDMNTLVYSDTHIITPEEVGLPTVSNNVSELYAAIRALEYVPAGHHVTLHTDSVITLRRVLNPLNAGMVGVPDLLQERLVGAAQRLGEIKVILVGGHPTKAELASGVKQKNGLPVSRWNVLCDQTCNTTRDLCERELRIAHARKQVGEAELRLEVEKACLGLVEEVAAPVVGATGAA